MNTLKEMLKRHEGERLKAYLCPAGHPTIGVGWNMDARPLPRDIAAYLFKHGRITSEMSDALLDISIASARAACLKLYPKFGTFGEARQNALIDFVFNVGGGTAATFKNTNAAINAGRWDEAADNLTKSKWHKQVGTRAEELENMIREG